MCRRQLTCLFVCSGHYQWSEYRYRSRRVHYPDPRLVLSPLLDDIQFKTFAWMLSRDAWEQIREPMASIAAWKEEGILVLCDCLCFVA